MSLGRSPSPEIRACWPVRREAGQWRVADGTYRLALGRSATDFVLSRDVEQKEQLFGR